MERGFLQIRLVPCVFPVLCMGWGNFCKGPYGKGPGLAGRVVRPPCSDGCGPVRAHAQSRLAAGRPGPRSLSTPACCLSPHRLLTGCIQTSAYCGCALCAPRAWFRENGVQTCLLLFLAIVPLRDFVCVTAVTIIMLRNSPLPKSVAQNKKLVFGSRACV